MAKTKREHIVTAIFAIDHKLVYDKFAGSYPEANAKYEEWSDRPDVIAVYLLKPIGPKSLPMLCRLAETECDPHAQCFGLPNALAKEAEREIRDTHRAYGIYK